MYNDNALFLQKNNKKQYSLQNRGVTEDVDFGYNMKVTDCQHIWNVVRYLYGECSSMIVLRYRTE